MHPLYVLALLLITASSAALFVARQKKKKSSPLLVPAGLAGLGLSFLVSLSALFFSGEKSSEHEHYEVYGAAMKSEWQYPFSRLAEKTGGGKIVLIEAAPMATGPVLGSSPPVLPAGIVSHEEELQSCLPAGCSLSILKLKAGQEYVTSADLESALKNGAKGLIISAPLPEGAEALSEVLGDAEQPLIHIPIVLMNPASPGSYKAYLDKGSILGIVSRKITNIDWTTCQLNRKSPLPDLFALNYTWSDHGHQPSQGSGTRPSSESAAQSSPARKKKSQHEDSEE